MARRKGPTGASAWRAAADKGAPGVPGSGIAGPRYRGAGVPGSGIAGPRYTPPARKAAPARAARPASPAPVASQRYSAPAPTYSDSFSGGGGGGGGEQIAAPAAPPPPFNAQSDSGYTTQVAALIRALSDYEAENTADLTKYNTDFNEANVNLGWRGAANGAKDDLDTAWMDESKGSWDTTDQTKASGRAYQSQLNDFASRGTLQSTLYSTALDDLMRSFNQQRTGLVDAKTNFESDRARQLTSKRNEKDTSEKMAYQEALGRYNAKYGVL